MEAPILEQCWMCKISVLHDIVAYVFISVLGVLHGLLHIGISTEGVLKKKVKIINLHGRSCFQITTFPQMKYG